MAATHPLPQGASLSALRNHVNLRHSPFDYAKRLRQDLTDSTCSLDMPTQNALLAQCSAFLNDTPDDTANFLGLVYACHKATALEQFKATHLIEWHGYGARRTTALDARTFGQGTPCDLQTNPSRQYTIEAKAESLILSYNLDEAECSFKSALKAIDFFSSRDDAPMHIVTICDDTYFRIFDLARYEELYRGLCLDRGSPTLCIRHTYGEFDLLDGAIAYVVGARLVSSGLQIGDTHGHPCLPAILPLHDLGHMMYIASMVSKQNQVLRRMQIYSTLRSLHPDSLRDEVIQDALLRYSEGHGPDPRPDNLGIPLDIEHRLTHAAEELPVYYQCLQDILSDPPDGDDLWNLPEPLRVSALRQLSESHGPRH